jgi:hypothetical protein
MAFNERHFESRQRLSRYNNCNEPVIASIVSESSRPIARQVRDAGSEID